MPNLPCLKNFLWDSKINKANVCGIVLVGGSTCIPHVRNLIPQLVHPTFFSCTTKQEDGKGGKSGVLLVDK
ncbi:uncharacterized protein PGTG_16861 [Puccinia graminis f. sp. tritici CRL 75-36-700-3]|uniref:Uncharacterized protein n=1 Tax=Puccinia graminis f. sp. tritici (strain CRL 75-36-700-3 / race SCCL) TaxID=418459 RepID=E3L3J1_PUCGT|nr:uncharacterized protein PGTG_16861 [Puccinia graminis f. sp. tritici CRL 75-36-700-3]EFP91116.1 hypothetical protein PGTG_16861 [Puccinia graminis f. sp. tritici CRL 75-36-700-3]